jgi:hypothetical protein
MAGKLIYAMSRAQILSLTAGVGRYQDNKSNTTNEDMFQPIFLVGYSSAFKKLFCKQHAFSVSIFGKPGSSCRCAVYTNAVQKRFSDNRPVNLIYLAEVLSLLVNSFIHICWLHQSIFQGFCDRPMQV